MSEQFKINIKPTERGFMRGEFLDMDGNFCIIQDSSLATEYALRLGQLEGTHHRGHCLATMHLTKEMAQEIIRLLMRFAYKGTIAEPSPSADFGARLITYMEAADALKDADDRKLLWLFKQLPITEQIAFSPQDAVVNAIEDRLYPEYDGDKVKMTDHGWSTPEGEINYL